MRLSELIFRNVKKQKGKDGDANEIVSSLLKSVEEKMIFKNAWSDLRQTGRRQDKWKADIFTLTANYSLYSSSSLY